MEKFKTSLKGYKKEEVNEFVNNVVNEVENMLSQLKEKDQEIAVLKQSLQKYKEIEDTLNKAVNLANESSNEIKELARKESETILSDARRNASRIVNDALLQAEKSQMENIQLKRNIVLFKKRLRQILENQLDLVNDIDHIDIEN